MNEQKIKYIIIVVGVLAALGTVQGYLHDRNVAAANERAEVTKNVPADTAGQYSFRMDTAVSAIPVNNGAVGHYIEDYDVKDAALWEIRAYLNDAGARLVDVSYFNKVGDLYIVKVILRSHGRELAGVVRFKYLGGNHLKDESWDVEQRNVEWL